MSIIKIDKEIVDRCSKFSEERIKSSSTLYAYRGESSKAKMVEDCLIGTLGEWGAYCYLRGVGVEVSEPDMNIYPTKRKSFSADLVSSDCNFHVKSQSLSSFKRYGSSWLLQRTDKIVLSPSDSEYFLFTKVDGSEVHILGCCLIKDIVEGGLFSECRVPAYRKTKVALYLNELIANGINLSRF
jgi:hypothetical protein